ncbi:MAG: ABC transporter ATP-binding protein [bacterium]
MRFLVALLCMSGVAGLTAVSMWLIRSVIDNVFLNQDKEMLYLIVWLVPIIFICKGICAYGQNYLMAYIGQKVTQRIRNQLYQHINALSMEFFSRNSTGSLIARVTNDAQLLQNALNSIPANIVRDGLTVIFLLGLLFYLHWKFALIAFVVFPIASWPIVYFGKKMRYASRQGQHLMAGIFSHIEETVQAAVIVRAFNKETQENIRFEKKYEKYLNAIMRYVRSESLSPPVMELIGALAITFIIWYGGNDVIKGFWTTGSFFAFLGGAISMYQPLKNFSRLNPVIQQASAGAERIFKIIDEKPVITNLPGAAHMKPFAHNITCQAVDFAYVSDEDVLHGIDLEIKKGESVALVGPSGSGKTTLISLLLRLYDPSQGTICIDGTDIKQLSFSSLRSQFGIVTQDILLFNESVMYNVSYGREEATEEEVKQACITANAHDFIMNLPQKYESIIGERGMLLSGGQKQRLSIARAILRNPHILILDEATSSLDAESEQLVQEAMEQLLQDRTVIIIAHRLATVKKVDRILVLDNGRIVEKGSHAELFKKEGIYKKLYKLQLLNLN